MGETSRAYPVRGRLIGIVLAAMLAVMMLAPSASIGQGKSHDPLPNQAKACDTPAAEHNPHCQQAGGAAGVPSPTAQPSGELALTGFPAGLLALVGMSAAGLGVGIRRLTRS